MASIQYVVNAVDGASATFARIAGSADNLLHQLDDISKKSATARVGLDGDKQMGLTLDKLDLKMANLAKRVATGKVGVEGQARAMLQIRTMELELDKLNGRHVTAHVKVDVDRGFLGRIFGGGGGLGGILGGLGGAAGGAASGLGALGGGGGDVTQAIKGGAIGAAALGAAALAPAAIPTLLGGGIGGLGLVLTQAKGLQTVLADIIKTLKTAAAPLKGAFGDILKNFDQFIKSQGPGLREMFKASLPFLNLFARTLETLGKTLLPVITQSLRQMRPYLPIISQGFVAVIQGLADMIKAIGPRGMQASAMLFVDLCRAMGFALTVLGKLVNGLAVIVQYTVHAIHTEWRDLQHLTADAFDQIRHYIAASWNATWRDTITRTQNGISDVVGFFRTLTSRALAAMFGFGHSLAAFMRSAFTDMWNAAKNVAGSIWHWLTGWVHDLPGWLRKLLHISSPSGVFYDIGKQMMMGLFHGIKDHAQHARGAVQSAVGGICALGGPTSGDARAAMEYARSRRGALR